MGEISEKGEVIAPFDPQRSLCRKRKGEQLSYMECPVCLEFPRKSPIYSCKNGHIICKDCQPRVSQCPTCRDDFVQCRNIIAEKLLETALKDYPFNCKFDVHGCSVQDLVANIEYHEKICMFRSVKCPANHINACSWMGPLNKLIKHVIQVKCTQVVKANPSNSNFVSTLEDYYINQNQTVFFRSTPFHWMPVMLLSEEALEFFCYAIFYRDASGYWYAYVRSFASPAILKTLRVEIKCKKKGTTQTGDQFVYTGSVYSSEATIKDIRRDGNYLLLMDGQVKKLQYDNKTIMEYNITLSQEPSGAENMKRGSKTKRMSLLVNGTLFISMLVISAYVIYPKLQEISEATILPKPQPTGFDRLIKFLSI